MGGKRSVVNRMTKIKPVVHVHKVILVTQPVHVKLTETERAFLDNLVQEKRYESRSSAIRAGLGMLFEKHKMPQAMEAEIEKERRRHQPRRRRRFS